MNLAPEILKWVGIAFAAGFIGYFGRYLAMSIIDRARKKKTQETPGETPSDGIYTSQAGNSETDESKLEKKRLKLEKKRAKKVLK